MRAARLASPGKSACVSVSSARRAARAAASFSAVMSLGLARNRMGFVLLNGVPWNAAGRKPLAALRHPARILDGHERRQVLVLAAERVIDPRAHARESVEHKTGVHEIFRRPVGVRAVGERMEKAQLIGQLANVRHQFADLFAALPARLEVPQRLGEVAIGPLERHQPFIARQRLAVALDQLRLVIKRVHVAQGA